MTSCRLGLTVLKSDTAVLQYSHRYTVIPVQSVRTVIPVTAVIQEYRYILYTVITPAIGSVVLSI